MALPKTSVIEIIHTFIHFYGGASPLTFKAQVSSEGDAFIVLTSPSGELAQVACERREACSILAHFNSCA